jgi:hypothetical protein
MKKIIFTACLFISIGVTAQEKLTDSQKTGVKNALNDSYEVIQRINSLNTTDTLLLQEKQRNVEHIDNMMYKTWLFEMLTTEEKYKYNSILK